MEETGAHSDKLSQAGSTAFLLRKRSVTCASSLDGWIVGDLLACVEGRRKELESEKGHLLSRLSRTPGARLDVACSRLEARVIYQAATANIAITVQELTRGDLQCVCVAW